MTDSQYKKSIQTGDLQLNFWDNLTHYLVIIFILAVPISFFWIRITNGESLSLDFDFVTSTILPLGVSFLFYLWQKHKLRFVQIQSLLSPTEIKQILESAATEKEWHVEQFSAKIFIARSNHGFNFRSWGEQITVLVNNDTIYLNSICDPEKRSSFSSGGMNKKNIEFLISKFTKPCG